MNLLSSTSVFGFYTLLSRVLGYLSDILIAIFLGTSVYADAFFVAFRLPNTFRRLFAEGTFNAAFIPSYASEKLKSKEENKEIINSEINKEDAFKIIKKLEKETFSETMDFLGFWKSWNKPTTSRTITPHIIKFFKFI